jgi:hypothetical protein
VVLLRENFGFVVPADPLLRVSRPAARSVPRRAQSRRHRRVTYLLTIRQCIRPTYPQRPRYSVTRAFNLMIRHDLAHCPAGVRLFRLLIACQIAECA